MERADVDEARRFFKTHGHFHFGKTGPEGRLREWAELVRGHRKSLRPGERRALAAIGFPRTRKAATWERWFAALLAFRANRGHCLVPRSTPLGRWVTRQRVRRFRGQLPKGREARLTAIGFVFNERHLTWDARVRQLEEYQRLHGHGAFPSKSENSGLAAWLRNQERTASDGRLDPALRQRLLALGLPENPRPGQGGALLRARRRQSKWDTRFAELLAFRRSFRHCDVPARYVENPKLAAWVLLQRVRSRSGRLLPDEEQLLRGIGFRFDIRRLVPWDVHYAELRAFRERHGHCDVPQHTTRGPTSLAQWVAVQRRRLKKGTLAARERRLLEELGFSFAPKVNRRQAEERQRYWERMFAAAQEYAGRHGSLGGATSSRADNPLAGWLQLQRSLHHRGKLDAERAKRLSRLGLSWTPRDEQWEAQLLELQAHRARTGRCGPPYPSEQLRNFVDVQRRMLRSKRLRADRKARLDELGFEWTPTRPQSAEAQLSALARFRGEHGHLAVPAAGATLALTGWLEEQRRSFRAGRLPAGLRRDLLRLGVPLTAEETRWEERYADLSAYCARHGRRWPEGGPLAEWLRVQRRRHARGLLDLEQEGRLRSLGALE
ncbi:MAG: helicase associated domain-containing protein [Myxococcaceae bacterium]